jgi:hypothetical protein
MQEYISFVEDMNRISIVLSRSLTRSVYFPVQGLASDLVPHSDPSEPGRDLRTQMLDISQVLVPSLIQ